MYPDQRVRNKKIVTAFLLVFAVVIIAIAVSALSRKDGISPASGVDSGTSTTASPAASHATYKDGTYTADASYATPGGDESITLSITIKGSAVAQVDASQSANNRESEEYQTRFASAYKSYVAGKPIDSISVSRISGASLTTGGFNDALEQIKSQAR